MDSIVIYSDRKREGLSSRKVHSEREVTLCDVCLNRITDKYLCVICKKVICKECSIDCCTEKRFCCTIS